MDRIKSMNEVVCGVVLFACLLTIYTLGWLAGMEHSLKWSRKKTLDKDHE